MNLGKEFGKVYLMGYRDGITDAMKMSIEVHEELLKSTKGERMQQAIDSVGKAYDTQVNSIIKEINNKEEK